jgi:hypothetical protein
MGKDRNLKILDVLVRSLRATAPAASARAAGAWHHHLPEAELRDPYPQPLLIVL